MEGKDADRQREERGKKEGAIETNKYKTFRETKRRKKDTDSDTRRWRKRKKEMKKIDRWVGG